MRPGHDVSRRTAWVSYLRVSTAEQADRDLSLPAQRHAVSMYAAARGAAIAREFLEAGFSGKNTHRPGFRRMLEDVLGPASDVGVIVVNHTSRFTRNATEARVVKSRLRKIGVRVLSICQDLPDDPMGELMEGIYECIDQYESQINGVRTAAAMAQCARDGFHPSRHAPYGYRRQPVVRPNAVRYRLVPEPAEAEIVREIFRLYINHGGAKLVACTLNEAGHRYRTGGRWTKGLVFDVISETAAVGTYFYGRRRSGKPRPQSEWIKIKVGPIVDQETFDLAQRLRGKRDSRLGYSRGVARPHVLTGLLRCGRCGASLQLETSGKKVADGVYEYCYYNCRRTLRAGAASCPGRRVRTEVLDAAVLAHIADNVCTPERVAQLRAILESRGLQVAALLNLWRTLVTQDVQVGRAYVVRLIERVVLDGEKVTVVARPKDAGTADTLVSELLDNPPTSDDPPTS